MQKNPNAIVIDAPISMDFRHSIAGNKRLVVDNEYVIRKYYGANGFNTALTIEPSAKIRLIGADIVQRVNMLNFGTSDAAIIGFNAAKTNYLRRLEIHVIMRLMQSLQHGAALRIGEVRLETCG